MDGDTDNERERGGDNVIDRSRVRDAVGVLLPDVDKACVRVDEALCELLLVATLEGVGGGVTVLLLDSVVVSDFENEAEVECDTTFVALLEAVPVGVGGGVTVGGRVVLSVDVPSVVEDVLLPEALSVTEYDSDRVAVTEKLGELVRERDRFPVADQLSEAV